MPKVIQVIASEITNGEGKLPSPIRTVWQHHSLEGDLLAESDSWSWNVEQILAAFQNNPTISMTYEALIDRLTA